MAVYPLGGREGRLILLHSSLLLSSPTLVVTSTEVMRSEVSLSNRTYRMWVSCVTGKNFLCEALKSSEDKGTRL